MYTLENIYQRLLNGTTATKRVGPFAEPVAGPAATGHTLDDIYNLIGTRVPVPKTGDATDGATGVNFPNPRFTVNAGTVKDNLTGLIWLKNAKCTDTISGITPAADKLAWQNAKDWIAGLKGDNTLCGLNDGSTAGQWRLPTLRELQSLIHYGYFNPALSNTVGTAKWTTNGDPFDNVKTDLYWSATTLAVDPTYAWVVDMYGGIVSYDDKTNTYYVLPVR